MCSAWAGSGPQLDHTPCSAAVLIRTIDDVEYVTLEWVDWFNNRRHSKLDCLLHAIPGVPACEIPTMKWDVVRVGQTVSGHQRQSRELPLSRTKGAQLIDRCPYR